MTTDALVSWPRPHFQPGGGDAHLFYKIHGAFAGAPAISRARHRCAGVPAGCDIQMHTRASNAGLMDFGIGDDWIGRNLRESEAELAGAIASTDQCLVLSGTVSDPPSLDYFRDAVGLVMALLESGGVAVFDPHMFKWWSVDEWRERAFEPNGAVPRHHTVILVSEEPDEGGRWYHTRGMLKFGRPDLSIRNVPPELHEAAEDLCNRLIEMQAFGGLIPEGQPIKMNAFPPGWRCHHAGDMDDPEFNNVHIEIRGGD